MLYPNPVKQQLCVNATKYFSKINILNVMGQIVMKKHVPETKKLVLNTSLLENGYYTIQIIQEDKKWSFPFIKAN